MGVSLLARKLAARAIRVGTERVARRNRREFGALYDPQYLCRAAECAAERRDDPLLARGQELHDHALSTYRDRFKHLSLRCMIHIPPSGAGLYSFSSWMAALNHMGVPTETVGWNDPGWRDRFETFKPSLFLTSDRPSCLQQFDWAYLRHLKSEIGLIVCLMAARDYDDGSDYLRQLDHAVRGLTADLYYFVGIPPFNREFLGAYFQAGFDVVSIPWAANPLLHYKVPGDQRLDYFFVGSNDPYKVGELVRYLCPIVQRHRGIILGDGFGCSVPRLQQEYSRYYYNVCKIAVNYHEPGQVKLGVNLNERAFVIPACGAFQLIDRPKALSWFFKDDEIASAGPHPADYYEAFRHYLDRPEERRRLAAKGMERVYAEHTVFHRMDTLVQAVSVRRERRR